jgi:hypothetical protein
MRAHSQSHPRLQDDPAYGSFRAIAGQPQHVTAHIAFFRCRQGQGQGRTNEGNDLPSRYFSTLWAVGGIKNTHFSPLTTVSQCISAVAST